MGKLGKEDKAGLYITIIFHLVVIIVLLASQIGAALKAEDSFVLDFSRQEELEKEKSEEVFKEEISERVERLLSEASVSQIRNVAVDRLAALKDDRGTNAEELYKEAERLQKELDEGYKPDEPDEDYVSLEKTPPPAKEKPKKEAYSGPSVVSYSLEGRKASRLPIPAYRCLGAGYVTVLITVDPSGRVLNAKVAETVSSSDKCLRDFALRAARLSRFSASASAPARQDGDIVYMFIAQ